MPHGDGSSAKWGFPRALPFPQEHHTFQPLRLRNNFHQTVLNTHQKMPAGSKLLVATCNSHVPIPPTTSLNHLFNFFALPCKKKQVMDEGGRTFQHGPLQCQKGAKNFSAKSQTKKPAASLLKTLKNVQASGMLRLPNSIFDLHVACAGYILSVYIYNIYIYYI